LSLSPFPQGMEYTRYRPDPSPPTPRPKSLLCRSQAQLRPLSIPTQSLANRALCQESPSSTAAGMTHRSGENTAACGGASGDTSAIGSRYKPSPGMFEVLGLSSEGWKEYQCGLVLHHQTSSSSEISNLRGSDAVQEGRTGLERNTGDE
jgi:hypothetical protein